jgi:hypothetical protein
MCRSIFSFLYSLVFGRQLFVFFSVFVWLVLSVILLLAVVLSVLQYMASDVKTSLVPSNPVIASQ